MTVQFNMKDFNKGLQRRKAFDSLVSHAVQDKPIVTDCARLFANGLKLGTAVVTANQTANRLVVEVNAAYETAQRNPSLTNEWKAAQLDGEYIAARDAAKMTENELARSIKYMRHVYSELQQTTDSRKRLQLLKELRKHLKRG